MKLLVTHDAKGNIRGLVTQPDNAPPGGVAAKAGHLVTAVEVPGALGDLADPKSHAQLVDLIKSYRIETKMEGKLVKKSSAKGR